MQEPTKTLIDCLKSNWNLKGRLHKSKITFRRGEPADLATRFSKNPITIEITKLLRPIIKRVLTRSISREILTVSVWQLIRTKTESEIQKLLDDRQKIEDEIERIIKQEQKKLTDVRFSKIENVRYLDDYDGTPPTLRAVFNVMCQYEK